jgi:hypothetical protein
MVIKGSEQFHASDQSAATDEPTKRLSHEKCEVCVRHFRVIDLPNGTNVLAVPVIDASRQFSE